MTGNKSLISIIIGIIILIAAVVLIWGMNTADNVQTQTMQEQTLEKKIGLPSITDQTQIPSYTSAVIETSAGTIELELYPNKAPITVANFGLLASANFYNNTAFHRVIKDFMIQGGDPLSADDSKVEYWGTGGPAYRFKDEFNDVKLVKGILAMANSGAHTNGSQFFIVTATETPWLDGKHTAFGKVTKGMDIVEKIENVAVSEPANRPLQKIIITSISVK